MCVEQSVSDERFRILVESIKDYAIYLLDETGHVVSWNAGARNIKGYESGEIIGKHFSTFYPKEVDPNVVDRQLEIAAREGRFAADGWRVRKDGSRFWASVVITPLRDASGALTGFAKITLDQTDRAYKAFIEATHAIVWTTDSNGHPNADSPSWRAFTGQTEEDWRERRGWNPVHPDDKEAVGAAWATAKAERRIFEHEFRMMRADGEYRWMAARALPLLDANGNLREWFGVTFDIHARKRAEAEREEAIARWTTTLHSIGDAVIATDVEGRVTFMNEVAEKLTGWTMAESLSRPLREVFRIVNEETRHPVEDPVSKVLRHGGIVGLANHTVLVRRDGTDIPIDDSASPIRSASSELFGVVMVFRDVTIEKRDAAKRAFLVRAGEELMTSADYRASLKTIVELAVPRLADWCSVEIVEPGETHTQQLAVAHVDPAKVSMARELAKKYPPDPNALTGVPNVLRTGRSELYPTIPAALLEAAAVNDEHRQMIRSLQLHSAMIVPLRGRDSVLGAITFVYAESRREYSEDDLVFAEELARRAGVVIERRKLEDERMVLLAAERAAREQADMANRSKDNFLATVSHELRNPLTAILGWAKLLLARELPPGILEPIRTIERNARSQARMIEDMLDVARIMSGKLRLELGDASARQAVMDALEAAKRAAETKDITIVSNIIGELELRADQVRLQQIVTNLVLNAVKFTPSGGSVTVTAEGVRSTLRIIVSDTGEGIERHMLKAIFEPFRQEDDTATTRRHGGLGLGLAIVRQLVLAHGGSVHAESAGKGKGSTFIVELPLDRSTGLSEAPLHSTSTALPDLTGVRVLIVDDDDDLLTLTTAMLTSAKAIVQVASSAEDALGKLAKARPNVIVSDLGMPDIDGYELMRRVRALPASEGGRTPAIALSAYARHEDAENAYAVGFQRYITKPLDPAEIVIAVYNLARLVT